MRLPLLCIALLFSASPTLSQPTPCRVAPADYEGDCYRGALPAIFDDFAYTSAPTTGNPRGGSGNLFGVNTWPQRSGEIETRAWYRSNRDDVPVTGSISFEDASTMRMTLPANLRADQYIGATEIMSGFTMQAGTYHWRVRFSDQWQGQALRHTAWTTSPDYYYFDKPTADGAVRYHYWSEIDIENENHVKGEWRGERFLPNFVPRIQITQHRGLAYLSDGGTKRLNADGLTDWDDGTGTLVRRGPAVRASGRNALRIPDWDEQWWYFHMVVDDETRSVTYRMLPERPDPRFDALSLTIGDDFYPVDPMAAAFAIHWLKAYGTLQDNLWMDVDWFYFTPHPSISHAETLEQVQHLRGLDLPRVNTTDRATFEDRSRSLTPTAIIEGPRTVECGQLGQWQARVKSGGTRYVSTLRYQIERADGSVSSWVPHYDRAFSWNPTAAQTRLIVEAEFVDLWAPSRPVRGRYGWEYPAEGNHTARARLEVQLTCSRP